MYQFSKEATSWLVAEKDQDRVENRQASGGPFWCGWKAT
jgi:hypothetical protein